MRALAYDFFQQSPVMAAPLFALLLFVVVFALVIVRAVRARSEEMDGLARLALEEETTDVQP